MKGTPSLTWNAWLTPLHPSPGGHRHAPVPVIVLQQHSSPRLVVLHHRGGHPQLLLVAELVDPHQVPHHGHPVPAEDLDGGHEAGEGVDEVGGELPLAPLGENAEEK